MTKVSKQDSEDELIKSYIADIKETSQKLSELVKDIPTEAILLWIDMHANDEEVIETVNRFTFLYTKKYRNGRQ